MGSRKLYSGIDLHKRTTFITTIDDQDQILKQQPLNNHHDGLKAYFLTQPGDHLAVVEPTTGWYGLRDLLDEHGIALKLAHAKYLKAISYAKVKTDKIDAETLAQLLRLDMIPEAHLSSSAIGVMCAR